MANQYLDLEESLWPIADAAIDFFRINKGITNLKKGESIDGSSYKPTLTCVGPDKYYWCVEVSSTAYKAPLDAFVLECQQKQLPVKLYVAFPNYSEDRYKYEYLTHAQQCGVGVVEINVDAQNRGIIRHEAVPLSLVGIRPITTHSYPKKYIISLSEAEETFKRSSPSQGCLLVYQEIENLSRRIIDKTRKRGYWKKHVKMRVFRDSWDNILKSLIENLDYEACPCPSLTSQLLSRVRGLTPVRNLSGHKPRTVREQMERDRRLRTCFDGACDILEDLINASKPLRI